MQKKQRYITASVTLAAAAVTAHLMQSGGSPGSGTGAPQGAGVAAASTAPELPKTAFGPVQNEVTVVAAVAKPTANPTADAPTNVMSDVGPADALPRPPQDALMPGPLAKVGPDLRSRMADTVVDSAKPVLDEPARNEFGLACGPVLSAKVSDAAMVALTLTAPCRSEDRITVHHGALAFSAKTNNLGSYTVDIPALETTASFAVSFGDGTTVSTEADVPLVAEIQRVALNFEGDAGLQIHALEFGAGYNEDGHIWAGRTRDVASAAKAGGGYLVSLGDAMLENARLAEIYTFPENSRDRDGVVRLSVEAEVTAYNCETDVAGQTMERAADGTIAAVSMTVSMPECAAIGEYLVLKNLLRDIKIASN